MSAKKSLLQKVFNPGKMDSSLFPEENTVTKNVRKSKKSLIEASMSNKPNTQISNLEETENIENLNIGNIEESNINIGIPDFSGDSLSIPGTKELYGNDENNIDISNLNDMNMLMSAIQDNQIGIEESSIEEVIETNNPAIMNSLMSEINNSKQDEEDIELNEIIIKEKSSKLDSIKSELEENKELIQKMDSLIEQGNEKLEESKIVLEQKKTELNELKENKEIIDNECKLVSEEISSVREGLESVRSTLKVSKRELTKLQNTKTKLESEIANIELSKTELTNSIELDQSKIETLNDSSNISKTENIVENTVIQEEIPTEKLDNKLESLMKFTAISLIKECKNKCISIDGINDDDITNLIYDYILNKLK